MAHFDAALDRQHALAVRRGVAFDDVAQVGDDGRFGHVAAPVGAGVVEAGVVGAADEVGHVGDRAVGHRGHRAKGADRGQVAGHAAVHFQDLGLGREAVRGQAGDLADLDLVELMVAAQQQHEILFS